MVFASTLRSVFGSHGGIKHAQSHTTSAVADPNSVIAAKKSILTRLFSCPVKEAKNTAAAQQQQQQQQQSLAATSTSGIDALIPFHIHAGATARASIRPRFAHKRNDSSSTASSLIPRRHLRYRMWQCNCPALLSESIRRHTVGCRASQQHAEEEGYEAFNHAGQHGSADRFCANQIWPSIIIQQCKNGMSDDSTPQQLILTAASPIYQQIIQSLAAVSHVGCLTISFIPRLLQSLSSSTASIQLASSSCVVVRDLPDEKNNDHIPLPPLTHTIHTVNELGDCYTGQLCPLTSQQHGRGVMQYANGESYAGEWENGQQHGEGVMCYNDGRYAGKYAHGHRCGTGVWESVDGNKYSGEWAGGLREGKGQEWQGDKLIYEGEWLANARHGFGVAQSVGGGWRYEGEWVNGVMDGYGSIEYSSGEVWEGQWHAGVMHGEGMRISSTGSSQLETIDQGSIVLSQAQPASGRQLSEEMGALDTLDAVEGCTTGSEIEGAPNTRSELLSLLTQVASLQSALVDKLSRVEELLVQPPTTKQSPTLPTLMGAPTSMAA